MKERIIVGADGRKYITTEPQINKREWQGLTDEEIADKQNFFLERERPLPYLFARAIEEALRRKNT